MVTNHLLTGMILQVDSYDFAAPGSETPPILFSSKLPKVRVHQLRSYHSPGASLGGSSHDLDTWLITMVIVSALRIGLFPFQMGCLWLINGGDPNHLQVLG